MLSATSSSPAFVEFVRDAEALIDDPHAVAARLGTLLTEDGWLAPEDREPGTDSYRQHLLHVSSCRGLSVVALVWRPGQRTPIHDHVAWCVVGVHRGEEHEVRYRMVSDEIGDHLVEDGHTIGARGSVTVLTPPGDIHAVVNDSAVVAASLHVYGADLRERGTSVRRCYRMPVR